MNKPPTLPPPWALSGALLLAVGLPCGACGFHGTWFRGNFYDDWESLKPRLAENAQTVKYINGRPVLGVCPIRESVIQELINILRYVDPYNDAPDSPAWMHSENGRENARESAQEILHELGAQAAPSVWEALENDIRFDTPNRQQALRNVRSAQEIASQVLSEMRFEMRRFPQLKKALEGTPEADPRKALLASWADLVATLPLPILPLAGPNGTQIPQGIRATPSRDGKQHRPMPMVLWSAVIAARGQQVGSGLVPEPNLIRSDQDAAGDPKLRTLIYNFQQAQVSLMQKQEQYQRQMTGAAAFGDMLPSEEFRPALERVLLRIGKAAVPSLEKSLKSFNPQVALAAHRLLQNIQAQKEPMKPEGVAHLELPGERLARLALELWDSGDPAPNSALAARARQALQARGKKAVPEILQIVECAPMNLEKEGLQALKQLTGEDLGPDLKAWQAWQEEQAAQERLADEAQKKIPPPDAVTTGGELSIGPRPGAPASKTAHAGKTDSREAPRKNSDEAEKSKSASPQPAPPPEVRKAPGDDTELEERDQKRF